MSQFPPPEMNLSIFNPYFFDESNQYLLSTGNEAISYAGTTDFNGSIITGQQLTFNDNTISNRFISGLYELQMCNNTGTNNVFNILTNSTNTILNSLQYNSSMSFYTTDGSGNNELILNLTNSNIQLGYASSSISFLGNNFDSSSSSFSLLSSSTNVTAFSNCSGNLILGNTSGSTTINGALTFGSTSSLTFNTNSLLLPNLTSISCSTSLANIFIANTGSVNLLTGTTGLITIGSNTSTFALNSTSISFPNVTSLISGTSLGNIFIANTGNCNLLTGTTGLITIGSNTSTFALNSTSISFPNVTSLISGTSLGNIFINNTGNCNLLTGTTATLNFLANTSTININSSTINFPNVTTLNIATSSTSISTITIGNNTYNNNIYLNGSLLGITAIDSSNSSITIFSTPTTVSIGKVSSTLSLIGNILNSTSSSFTLLGNPTSITAFGNCSTLTLGNASGTTTINGNLSLSSSSFDLANSSVTLFSTPTTISCFPNVITLNIATTSPSSSTIIIGNNTYSNSITLYGSSLNCSTSLASIFTQTTSSINLLGGVTSTNTITIGGGCWIVLNANYIYSNQASIVLFSSSTSVNFASIATTISIGTSASSSQSISILNSSQSSNAIYLNASIIGIGGSTISTLNLFTQSVITTCNFLTNCPLIAIGNTSSTFNIGSSTINIAHCTSINNGTTGNMAFCNSTTGYVSIGGASLGLTLGCTTSANVIQGSSISFSNATSLICSSSLANVFNQTTVGNINLFGGITGTSIVTIGGGCWIVLNANYIYSNQSNVVLFSNSINSNYSAGSQYVSIGTGYSGSQYITLGTTTNTGGLMYLNSGSIGIGGSSISSINLFTESVITSANLLSGSSLSTLNFGTYSLTLNIGTNGSNGQIINIGNSSFPSYTTINLNANTIANSATSLTLFNTTSTTIHAFGAGTTIVVGGSGGSFTINNATCYVGNTLNTTSTGSAYLFNTTCTTGYLFGNCSNITIGANSSTLTLNSSTIVSNSTSLTLFNSTSTGVTCFNGATLGVNLGNTGYANASSQSNTTKPNSCIQFNAPISLPPAYNSLSGGGAVNHWTNIPLCMYGYQTIAMTSSGTYSPAPAVTFYIYKLGHIVQISWNSFTLGTQISSGSIYFNLYSSIPEINSNTTVQCPIYNGSTVGFAQLTAGNTPLQFFTGIGFSSTYTQETIGSGTLTYICALTSNGY